MRLEIKNMVCRHCVNALTQALTQLGFTIVDIGIGYAEVAEDSLDASTRGRLDVALLDLGFELIEKSDDVIVERVKQEIKRHTSGNEPCPHTLSVCLADALGKDYRTISRVFKQAEGTTIENYYISVKIERIKELLRYGDATLSEIAYRLGYSSPAFLSRQFKQITGMTPSQYIKSTN